MNILLDTHAFVWWSEGDTKMSLSARKTAANEANTLYLSMVSVWELQIKIQLGKLKLSKELQKTIHDQVSDNKLRLLPISLDHIYTLNQLPSPSNHRDPFDRLLVAQAVHEKIALVSGDPLLKNYPVQLIW